MNTSNRFDYIIVGAGCAGLSLTMHLIASGKFSRKKILLIDKEVKNKNDRTWCFWEKEPGLFQSIVYKEWQQLWIKGEGTLKPLDIAPYRYKLIRGIDFYNYCFTHIHQHPNIIFRQAAVESIVSNSKETYVVAGGQRLDASCIFNSMLLQKPVLQSHHYWLLQHFKGWFVRTSYPAFDPATATLMDFRTDQSNGTTFFYVLPFTPFEALIEYTIFSPRLLADEAYEQALKKYTEKELKINDYTVEEKEFGVIPMTNYSFPVQQNHIVNIGTAGGQTKASSGYTFRFIQKQSAFIVHKLMEESNFSLHPHPRRFRFYDSVLLHILHYNKMPGDRIFTRLFRNNKASQVLKFLDNETSLSEEISIIGSLPTGIFLKAAVRHLLQSV